MNNNLDEEWFGRKDVFNHENEYNTWTPSDSPIDFSDEEKHGWHDYVDSRRMDDHLRRKHLSLRHAMTRRQGKSCRLNVGSGCWTAN